MNIDIGDIFPDFTLNDENGNEFNLERDFSKTYLVLYFYPRDETPGCTKQACYFKDFYEEFKTFDCEIIGISSDDKTSHEKFKSNYNLPFKLLSDQNSKLRKQLKLPKDFFGLSPGRVTFLININKEILYTHRSSLNMKSHINSVLKFLNKNS
ncbi:MAG: peroxiredoxin [Flavobacteriales bacterium]|jgi:peroxiredoxin Q/BCP|tara:strand:+ start:1093 stop:1551 length:459 start_codon:yes stop_codon:yes gene_type:complete